MHPKLNNPIPRSEKSLEIKLARKVSKRSKRDLRGLWETLAPGSTVVRTSDTTTVIKELGVPEVSARNSDIAKFGTCAEHNTELWQYAQRRSFHYEKTTEEKIAKHTKDLKKKYRGEIKIRHRPTQSDAASGVSSANSKVSKAMSSRKPKKPTPGSNRSSKSSTTRHRTPRQLPRRSHRKQKGINELRTILISRILFVPLAMTLPLLLKDKRLQIRLLERFSKKKRHSLLQLK